MSTRPSVDTLGLVIVLHKIGLTPAGKAADAADVPTSGADEGPVEEHYDTIPGETVDDMLGRIGWDENCRAEIRCRTQQEDTEQLARLIVDAELHAPPVERIGNATVYPNGACLADRDADGRILVDGVPVEDPDDFASEQDVA